MSEIAIQWLGRISYEDGLELQNRLVAEMVEGRGSERILILEHEPVYTIGRTRDTSSLRQPDALPHPVFETNRGGQATWHGPGQLVAYPILNLGERGRDLHRYIRFIEDIIIATCARSGITTRQRDGLTGVWAGDRKIASIGVGVRRWISMHGLALNVTKESLAAFSYITPCGIADVQMTSMESEVGHAFAVREVGETLASLMVEALGKVSTLQP